MPYGPPTEDRALTTDAPAPPEPLTGSRSTLVVFSDVACPWGTVVVLRLLAAREELDLVDEVALIHLAHPLELMNDRPLARRVIDAEMVTCAMTTPAFGWSPWRGRLDQYPVSSLLAVEAVQAARRQSERAAEQLDLALRTALFTQSRCITMRHEILAAAATCPQLDTERLTADLDAGVARPAVMRQSAAARTGAATCSGYVVLPDGSGACNPGIELGWLGPPDRKGTPIVVTDDPDAHRALVTAAASA